jgi:hypothetical protein
VRASALHHHNRKRYFWWIHYWSLLALTYPDFSCDAPKFFAYLAPGNSVAAARLDQLDVLHIVVERHIEEDIEVSHKPTYDMGSATTTKVDSLCTCALGVDLDLDCTYLYC